MHIHTCLLRATKVKRIRTHLLRIILILDQKPARTKRVWIFPSLWILLDRRGGYYQEVPSLDVVGLRFRFAETRQIFHAFRESKVSVDFLVRCLSSVDSHCLEGGSLEQQTRFHQRVSVHFQLAFFRHLDPR
jgi:hypothetical protein